MKNRPVGHPRPERLEAYGLGRLDDESAEEVYRHLEICEDCLNTVVAVPNDALTALVREVAALISEPDGAAPDGEQGIEARVSESDAAAEPPVVPSELADHPRYRVLEVLGVGGMGVVYKAEQRAMDRLVAIKVVNRRMLDRPDMLERFRREVKAAARLSHPNIVTAYDADQAGETHFFVMEYVAGKNLAVLVAQQGPLPVARACECIRQAALGLQHAWEKGMVHRDVKPANLVLSSTGQVKILDFGVARLFADAGTESAGTATGLLLGTVDFMAPEQADAPHLSDIRADIYSLGCTLYFLLTGRAPFPGGSPLQKIKAHAQQPPRPVTDFRGGVPAQLLRVLDRMLAKDPAGRYQVPAEVAEALGAVAAADPAVAGAGRSGREMPPVSKRPRQWRLLAVTAAVLAGVGWLGWLFAPTAVLLATNRGRLTIETEDPHVQVTVRGDNETVVADHAQRRFELPAGEYQLEAVDMPDGVRWLTRKLTISRAGREVVDLDVPVIDETGSLQEIHRYGPLIHYPAALAISHDGRTVFTSDRHVARFYDLAGSRQLGVFCDHTDQIWAQAFSPDDRYAVSGQQDNLNHRDFKVRVWDVHERRLAREAAVHEETVSGLVFCPGGHDVLSSSWDKTVCLWNADAGELKHRFGLDSPVLCVAVSPDGRLGLFGTLDQGVQVWDIAERKELVRFRAHGANRIEAVAFLPGGRTAVSGGHDGAVRLWNAETAAQQACLTGHEGPVRALAAAADGRRIISGSLDKTVRVWDLTSGIETARFTGHTAPVLAVALTPSGRFAVSCSEDGTARLWRMPRQLSGSGAQAQTASAPPDINP